VTGEPMVLQIKHLVSELFKLAQDTFPRSIKIRTEIAEGLRPILGDVTQLHQVLLNLCVNARDAMPDGGTLTIGAENVVLEQKRTPLQEQPLSGGFVVLSVSDPGGVIHPGLLDKSVEAVVATQ